MKECQKVFPLILCSRNGLKGGIEVVMIYQSVGEGCCVSKAAGRSSCQLGLLQILLHVLILVTLFISSGL